jgi:two-component system OmpR family sensor kinase/two-component system sensor histidine kinase BaeS
MNRLWARLSLAFVGVTLVTVLVVALLSGWSAGNQFQNYLDQRDSADQGSMMPGRGGMMGGNGGQMARHMMTTADLEYLDQLHNTLIIAALAAGGAGILLGIILSRAITAPLGNLAKAAHDFAAHQWDRRVVVEGTAEIAEVAQAFNAMADQLQRAEALRRNMMADIAHELRTPLTVMQGSLRALLDGVYPLEMKEVASLYDETRLLSRLVSDLRELALAEAGQLPLTLSVVDIAPILRTTADHFLPAAEERGTRIELDAPLELPPLCADPDRLAQVLHNLLSNALRHTPSGTIRISGAASADHVRINVKDSGEGIAPEDLPHVFDRFYRAEHSPSGAAGGSGLGLAIAKAWVEAMGGSIGVESTPGQGSTFWFTLRRADSV